MPLVLDSNKGITYPTWTTDTRPANPNQGQVGFNTSLKVMEIYDGTVWNPINIYSMSPFSYAFKFISF